MREGSGVNTLLSEVTDLPFRPPRRVENSQLNPTVPAVLSSTKMYFSKYIPRSFKRGALILLNYSQKSTTIYDSSFELLCAALLNLCLLVDRNNLFLIHRVGIAGLLRHRGSCEDICSRHILHYPGDAYRANDLEPRVLARA